MNEPAVGQHWFWDRRRLALAGLVGLVAVTGGLLIGALTGPDHAPELAAVPSTDELAQEPNEEDAVGEDAVGDDEAVDLDELGVATPATQLESVALEEVDLLELPWITRCRVGERGPVRLRAGPSRVADAGWYADPTPADEEPVAIFHVDPNELRYGDVTGDGVNDAVVVSHCTFGMGVGTFVEVWSHDVAGQPLHLQQPIDIGKFDGRLQTVELTGGALRITIHEGATGDESPHINGYPVEVVTDWTFRDGHWVADEVSRRDTTAASPPLLDSAGFSLPSGNVECSAVDQEVHCAIYSGLQPPPAEDCDGQWIGAILGPRGAGEPLCAGGLFTDGGPVLGYGERWIHGEVTCTAAEDGLRCSNGTGDGFHLSRARSSFS